MENLLLVQRILRKTQYRGEKCSLLREQRYPLNGDPPLPWSPMCCYHVAQPRITHPGRKRGSVAAVHYLLLVREDADARTRHLLKRPTFLYL